MAYFFTFLDHALNHLNTRFPADLQNALLATYFIPQKLPSLTDEVITKLRTEFEQVLPYPSELENEVSAWKVHMALTDPKNAESSSVLLHTCWEAEKHREYYPNIHTMLMSLVFLLVHVHVKGLSALYDD